ncbi:MAG: hypothetical protein JWL75_315 [Parcubacteria group bacterium]|nr:hypothetical protein [Parcubacteria group bacterium]
MKISFIVPAYNEESVIAGCVESILESIKVHPYDAEVIVVDNASTDRTAEIVSSYENVRLIQEPKKGVVWARKAGFEASTGDIIAFLDADNLVPASWLPKVRAAFEEDTTLLALTGPYIFYDTPWYVRATAYTFYRIGNLIDHIQALFKSHSMLLGGNFIIRREVIDRIGGFDTSIAFYGDDADIGRRVGEVGKLKWDFGIPMKSSGRRLMKQGVIATGGLYALNHFWINFFKRPYSTDYTDIRVEDKA